MPITRESRGNRHLILIQPPGDWTERQRALFANARGPNERRTVLIASDSPQLDVDLIGEAFDRLRRDDIVLGPTVDGGYYLIGVRSTLHQTAACPWDVLSDVRMSTGTELDEILTRCDTSGPAVEPAPPRPSMSTRRKISMVSSRWPSRAMV
jgi:uncharacterized protein